MPEIAVSVRKPYPMLLEDMRDPTLQSEARAALQSDIHGIEIGVAKGIHRFCLSQHNQHPDISLITSIQYVNTRYDAACAKDENLWAGMYPGWIQLRRRIWGEMNAVKWLRDDCTSPDDMLWIEAIERVAWKVEYDTFDILTQDFIDRFYGSLGG